MARVRFAARASLLAAMLGFLPIAARAAGSEGKPAESSKPAANKPQPAEAEPPEGKSKPAESSKPAGNKPQPAEAKPAESKPKPAEAKPRVSNPEKAKPIVKAPEAKTSEAKSPEPKPSEAKSPDATAGAVSSSSASDPQRGVGTRSVGPLPSAPNTADVAEPAKPAKSDKSDKPEKAEKQVQASHQKGKPPHTASSTLPAGATRPAPDRNARQKIADGPTDEDLRAGKDDPELRSLKAAERVLFPRPLSGVEPGWSWDLPEAISKDGPEVITQGALTLPPSDAHEDAVFGTPDAAWLKSLTMPNLPVVLDEFVIKYLRFYRDSASGKAIARVWAKKSGRYTAAMRGELARAGIPTDLVWLSMIESGHNPTITSPAGAAGLWQFMPDAGRTYGLTVDRWVDERLDPERSTQAASRYLSDLYRRFGSWELAIAAYNMGYGGLARSIRKYNSNDFWQLVRYEAGIPWETTLYVPKIFALSVVMNNKKAFGLDAIESDAPESFDVVLVGPSTALNDVAHAANVSDSELLGLNPGFLAGRTPPWVPGSSKPGWRVRVPAGKGAACTAALARANGDDDALETYVTKFGETVDSIANAHGVSEARLRAINHVEPKEVLAAGSVLLVPRAARVNAALPNEEVVVVPPREFSYAERSRLFYRVLTGDTLSRVANVFAVSVADIGLWNALDEGARLQSGMALQLFVDKTKAFAARTSSPAVTHVLVAGSPEFYDYFEGQNGRKRVVVAARDNDTLVTLGKRYGMTVGSMERINRRSRTDKLHSGESIVVYVDRGRAVTSHKEGPDSDDLASGTLLPLEPALDSPGPDLSEAPSLAPSVSNDAKAPAENGTP